MNKRRFDKLSASVALGVFLLPMCALYVATRLSLPRNVPAIFRQERIGMDGEPFTVFKFCSMREEFDQAGNPMPETKRMTRVGRWMRLRGVDELPQLFNVLRGEMSTVGPRPKPLNEINELNEEDRDIILSVRPGLCDPLVLAGLRDTTVLETSRMAFLKAYAQAPFSSVRDLRIMFRSLKILRGSHPEEIRRFPDMTLTPDNEPS